MKDKIGNIFMFYVLYLYRIPLGIQVENVVGKVVGMELMPSMPKFIPRDFCRILTKIGPRSRSELDRGPKKQRIISLTRKSMFLCVCQGCKPSHS